VDGSPAARAGVRPEDLIVAVNEQPVEGVDDLLGRLTGDLIGTSVQLDLLREGTERRVDVVPVELDA
jgi:S1-C subfamily serine protease